jgi:hypothetical protein
METPMAIDVWMAAGCPPTWSAILDTVHKGYLQASYEGRLAEYCDGWRVKLEREREKRVGKAA